jgi:hypothetical protein
LYKFYLHPSSYVKKLYKKDKLHRKKKIIPTILAPSMNWASNGLIFASRLGTNKVKSSPTIWKGIRWHPGEVP